jgi:hypothetical protein
MNKATNRRALAVYLAICLLYVSVAFRIPEKLSMKRIGIKNAPSHGIKPQGSRDTDRAEPRARKIMEEERESSHPVTSFPIEASPAAAAPVARTPLGSERPMPPEKSSPLSTARGDSKIEPRLFISIPITCYAIEKGWLDRETLIFSRKEGQNNSWSKPLDILKQQDEDSIKALVTVIGRTRLKEFLKQEAVDFREDLSPEDIMLGRGYLIPKKSLLALYDRFVHEECDDLFPLALAQGGVVKGAQGFRFVSAAEAARIRTEEEEKEWGMPNLAGLSIKVAIDKLAAHTSRIKVHGSGFVVDQAPKPFERLKTNSECAIYGRLSRE